MSKTIENYTTFSVSFFTWLTSINTRVRQTEMNEGKWKCLVVDHSSMFPLFLFPLFGIASADTVAHSYMDDVITSFWEPLFLLLPSNATMSTGDWNCNSWLFAGPMNFATKFILWLFFSFNQLKKLAYIYATKQVKFFQFFYDCLQVPWILLRKWYCPCLGHVCLYSFKFLYLLMEGLIVFSIRQLRH